MQGTVPSSTPLDLTVAFDGLGRLTSQTGTLGVEAVNRTYTYDGLSRLKTAVGPWEKPTGATGAVTWTYSYDALGNLRGQASTRTPSNLADVRTWSYAHTTKPHFLSSFAQANQPTETLAATTGGEVNTITRPSLPTETLVWNALGKLRQHKNSAYSYDAFGELVQTVTGPSGSTSSIVSVGDDFEYDITALRSNKYFSIQGVRIASLATSYTAPTASVPPALQIVIRYAEPLAAPAAAALLALGLLSLASLTLRRRTPVWLSVPGVGVLSFTLVALPFTAHAATLTSGPGAYGRHGEPILAYLVDHLGTIRGAVNQAGVVVETRDYAPFGESIAKTGTFSVQHRFTGQPQDDQAGGLYNYGARFYNAKWGRFISPDEMVQGFDSQGLNPFTYVLNRPTSLVDPTGQFAGVAGPIGSAIPLLGGVNPTYTTKNDQEVRTAVWNTPLLSVGTLGGEIRGADWLGTTLDFVSIGLTALDLALGGPSGEGIVPAMAIQVFRTGSWQAAKQAAKEAFEKEAGGLAREVMRSTRHGGSKRIVGVRAGKSSYRPKGGGDYTVTPKSGKAKDGLHFRP